MKMLKWLAAVVFAAALPCAALAQSNPGLSLHDVPTAGQWNSYFSAKQDVLNFVPLNSAGGVMLGRLVTAPPSSTTAGLNLTPGTAPGSPANGDLWATASGLFAQINGATVGPFTGAATPCTNCALTTNPLSQFAATTSAQLAGVISNETGTGLLVFNNAPALTSPVLTTPTLGVATGTSLVLGGATLIGSTLAVNATTNSTAIEIENGGSGNLSIGIDASANASIRSQNAVNLTLGVGANNWFTLTNAGAITHVGTTTLSAALTYGGVTFSNTVTGGGSLVGGTAPTLGTPTINIGSDATGDVYYRSSGGGLARLPIGTAGQILNVSAGLPAWATVSGTGTVTSLTAGVGISFSSGSTCTTTCTVAATGAPYFRVHQATAQTLTTSFAKVTFDTIDLNVGGAWSATNHNFNPLVAGTYNVCTGMIVIGTFATANTVLLDISKNGLSGAGGAIQLEGLFNSAGSISASSSISGCTLISMNGTTDTLEIDVNSSATSPTVANTNNRSFFSAELVGP